jgi:ferric-dicitrate binding protein FerR (iron transport regulator)
MKKTQDLYNYLKRTHVPRFANDSLKQRVKHQLYRIMDEESPAAKRAEPGIWRRGFSPALAGVAAACALGLAAFFLLPLFFPAPRAAYPSLMASSLGAKVAASYNGEPVALNVGQALKPGTTITAPEETTGELRINTTSLVRIYERSTVTLDQRGGLVSLRLARGTLAAHIEKPDRPFTLQVITDNCIIGIKSTTFLVAVEDDKTTHVALLEGVLSIKTGSGSAQREYTLQSGRELALTLNNNEISTALLSEKHRALLFPLTETGSGSFTGGRQSVTCVIQPVPRDSAVYIDGRYMGNGQVSFMADKDRKINLKIVRQGYDPYEAERALTENKTFMITLKKQDTDGAAAVHTPGAVTDNTGSAGDKIPVIRIDGGSLDWQDVKPLIIDPAGDISSDTPEADITRVYFTRTRDSFYAGIAFSGGMISDLVSIEYRVDFISRGNNVLSLTVLYENKRLKAELTAQDAADSGIHTMETGDVAGGRGFIEVGFPLAVIEKYLTHGNTYSCRVTSRFPEVADEAVTDEFYFR